MGWAEDDWPTPWVGCDGGLGAGDGAAYRRGCVQPPALGRGTNPTPDGASPRQGRFYIVYHSAFLLCYLLYLTTHHARNGINIHYPARRATPQIS